MSDDQLNDSFRKWLTIERLVPVVRTRSAQDAIAVCEALVQAGLRTLEITLTIPGASQAIAAFAAHPQAVVGAGSVRNGDDATQAIAAGARFVVTPIVSLEALAVCQSHGVPCVLGALTPTEIATAYAAGAAAVKVFPISAMGGPDYVRALKAPMPDIPLMVTGGVTLANAAAYLEAGAMAVGVGSELADVAALHAGRSVDVVARARAAYQSLSSHAS